VKATYPPDALARGKEGSATVLATVRKDGVVKSAEIGESSGDAALDQAALSAALQWRFKPALEDGEPIESQVRIPFHFHLAEHGPAEHLHPPAVAAPSPPPPPAPAPSLPAPAPPAPTEPQLAPGAVVPTYESNVRGRREPPSRGASDYHVDVEKLSIVPRANASQFLKLAPGILLTNEGGEGHAEQVFMRGFDAREGQDIEFSVDGVPINESGNLHGNGYSDTHFIIPEVIDSIRVLEGPYDPRQGNYAVAGSVDYHLGLALRGETAQFSVGNFGTYRLLLTWGPKDASRGTFVAADLYQTDGFGQNRDGRRASVIAQHEGRHGPVDLRITAQAYLSSFHTAGVLRDDDYRAGRKGFFDTYDPRQGEDASRYSLALELGGKSGPLSLHNQVFGIARPLRLRENFTGFLLDTQSPLQNPHGQRGDLIDLNVMEWTVGARGAATLSGVVLNQPQSIELGYFARGDFVSSLQQRIEAATGHPYHTDTYLDSQLGDIGLSLDANLRFLKWLALRGGVRGDLFTYVVNNLCAVQSVEHPNPANPPGDASCLSQQNFGAFREPNQHVSTASTAFMPRSSLILGPLWGLGATASAGTGVRSIDPQYITQDAKTPFADVVAYEGGLNYARRFRETMDLKLSSVVFYTHVDHDLIFSETAGRNVLANGTTRIGNASAARFTGPFWDLGASFTYVRATFDDTHLLVPYVPDVVFRFDGALQGDLPWWQAKLRGHPLRASLGAGLTYVGPRPLPYGARSDTIFALDGSASVGWWFADFVIAAQNLLDTQYRLGEYNYASDFHSQQTPTLVPVRHFTAGAPRTILFSIVFNYGGRQ
jgi:TonB family protein